MIQYLGDLDNPPLITEWHVTYFGSFLKMERKEGCSEMTEWEKRPDDSPAIGMIY
jgi:hypothetical protein